MWDPGKPPSVQPRKGRPKATWWVEASLGFCCQRSTLTAQEADSLPWRESVPRLAWDSAVSITRRQVGPTEQRTLISTWSFLVHTKAHAQLSLSLPWHTPVSLS
jgi:hypothetical protein